MAQITLQFSTEKSLISGIIRRLTWSDISHVDIVLPDGRLLGAHVNGGVKIRKPHYATFAKRIIATVEVSEVVEQAFYSAALSQLGKPYDWKGILNFTFQRNWRGTASWFCSELVAWCFEYVAFPILNVGGEVWRIVPRDLLLSLLVKVKEVHLGNVVVG